MFMKNKIIKISFFLILFLVFFFLATNYLIWNKNYKEAVYPNTFIGDISLDGLSLSESEKLISLLAQEIEDVGIIFKTGENSATLKASVISFDSDLSYPAFSFLTIKTAEAAFGSPSERSFIKYLSSRLGLSNKKPLQAFYTIEEDKIKSFLADNFQDFNMPASNAYFSIKTNNQKKAELIIVPEKIGKEIFYEDVLNKIQKNLELLQNKEIIIETRSEYPTIKSFDLEKVFDEAQKISEKGSMTLNFTEQDSSNTSKKHWEIDSQKIISWIGAKKNNAKTTISFDEEKIKDYLTTVVSPQIDQEIISPRLEIKDGRATNWQAGKDGRKINMDEMVSKIITGILEGNMDLEIITEKILAEETSSENNFKIKEIIGTGHSNFAGSSANRRHNINTGAASLHGLLIKPDEEFSLLKALGEINGETGYKTELVIKDNKTIPEFGGGLCQIGTTVFRTALAAGLPITQRRNHSYRVSYYEPAGTDATIYDPAPDFRFVNDTGNYILIQARIEGNDIYFDFWGKKDGRTVTITPPVIYNIVKPAPTKIIETEDLSPGEKKCTESSHNGADAYFDYTVIYPEGATTTPIQEIRFNSHYVPWQAVCLIGKTTTTTSEIDLDTASSTPIIQE